MSASDAARQRVAEGVWVGHRAAVGGRAAISGMWWVRPASRGGCWVAGRRRVFFFFFAGTRAGRQSRDAAKFADVAAVIVGADTMVVASGSLGDKPNLTVARRHWTSRAFDV